VPDELIIAPKRKPGAKRIVRWTLLVLAALIAVFALITWLSLPDVSGLRTTDPASTSLMRLQAAQAAKKGIRFSVEHAWVAFDRIPDMLKKCVLVSEDASFYSHKGIDFAELKESIKRDIRERRFVRGGSTITQQLAKNLYLSGDKTLGRKLKEALIARRLERTLSKNRIFALYLNVIELGPHVFGVQAAARHWFGKDVADLSLEEIVRLTAIIPRPSSSDPRTNDAWMKFKGRWIAETLAAVKAIGEDESKALVAAFE
jgi:monofunctional biosynthetic peptidoglycan transglycosylase